jgi:hypothetical protein
MGKVAEVIKRLNGENPKIFPGYLWGHSTKVLTLYVREIVLNSRYFTDRQVEQMSCWLYTPIDSIIIKRLLDRGAQLSFRSIKQIDTAEKFYSVQELLGEAAAQVGVPRVWFDDNWGDRQ